MVAIILSGCEVSSKKSFEKLFPKAENLLGFNVKLENPDQGPDDGIYGLKVKYVGDTIMVKFKFNGGLSEVKPAIGFKGDTLKLYFHLWCDVCATEWTGFELNYQIMNKSRKKYKILPVFISSEDLEKM